MNGRIYAHFHQYGLEDHPVLIDLMSIDAIAANDKGSVVHTMSGSFSVQETYEEIIEMLESLMP